MDNNKCNKCIMFGSCNHTPDECDAEGKGWLHDFNNIHMGDEEQV